MQTRAEFRARAASRAAPGRAGADHPARTQHPCGLTTSPPSRLKGQRSEPRPIIRALGLVTAQRSD